MDDKDIARFWSKVDISSECWMWTAGRFDKGYGAFWLKERNQNIHAHIVAYWLLVGPVPEGLELDHICRNRACVNPNHLEPVTGRINLLRGETLAARFAAQTHCVHGHPFDDANTLCIGNKRYCRACAREKQRRYRARLRGK